MDQQQTWGLPLIVLLIVAAIAVKLLLYLSRRKSLIQKYGHDIGLKIFARVVWQGMTSEQLIDSRGKPVDVDQTVYKTKTKETWKYHQTGKNRFKERIYVEDGIVVGWKD
jgi:hypothetical protein